MKPEAANEYEQKRANLGFACLCPRKAGQEARSFREASRSRSGMPVPTRWTFTSAVLAAVHCPSAALRPPGFACFRSPLVGTGIPALVNNGCCWKPGTEVTGPAGRLVPRPCPSLPAGGRKPPMSISTSVRTLASHACAQGKPGRKPGLSVKLAASRRPEAANEHQHKRANLGFACLCPRKAGQEARSFREVSPTTSGLRGVRSRRGFFPAARPRQSSDWSGRGPAAGSSRRRRRSASAIGSPCGRH